jgi:hypothetical protein
MTQTYISGAKSTVSYAYENPAQWANAAASHTASDETYVPFGQGVDISVSRNNNSERIVGVGARNATASIHKQYSGTATINGVVSNAWWLLGALGENTDGGVSGAYTHTYVEADSLPSFTIKTSMELGTTDSTNNLLGCRINTLSLSAAVNEALKFSIEAPYRYETMNTTFVSNVADTEPVFTFAHGSIELPDGTVIAAVQSVELTINNNLETVYGVGSRFMADNVAKNREYNFNITAAFNDQTKLLTKFLNGTGTATAPDSGSGTEIATMELTFTNDDGDILDINLTGVTLNEETLPQNVNEVIKENVTGWARGCTNVIYTNDVQTAPAEADN